MLTNEIYNLIICLIVFVMLTALFSVLIVSLIKMNLRTIRGGLDDEKIKKEYEKEQKRKSSIAGKVLDKAFPILVCALLLVVLCFSMYSKFSSSKKVGSIPTLKVVETGSMSEKHKDNTYLFNHKLNDQIQTYDLIVLRELPKEEELQLFDIVVYEINGVDIIHRIVGIEEPNSNHPNERWFVLRGDANKQADDFPVKYSQMKAIYRGQRIPFVGTFVHFMQSPAGILCFILVLGAVIATPIAEKKLKNAKNERIKVLTASATLDNAVAVSAVSGINYNSFGERKTFEEKLLTLSDEKKYWFKQLEFVLMQLPKIRVVNAKYHNAYRMGNKPVAKISIKGKSLYVYLAVNASEYQGVQYGFKDVSNVKAHGQFVSECKLTSARKLKNVKKIIASYGENIVLDMPSDIAQQFSFGDRKKLTFKQKLARLPKEKKARYKEILSILEEKLELSKRESKNGITFRRGRTPVVKLAIKGKSVYTYLAVDPKDYSGSKYGFKDVSSVKAHKNVPSECKVTSDRKAKYIKEIIKQKI